jgi:magnesium transporter
MIHSFVFSDGKVAAQNLDLDALKLVRGDKGLFIWVDLDQPTEQETKQVLEEVFAFHPLAIEDCISISHRPKLEEYDDYIFLTMHAVDFHRTEKFNTTELDLFLGRDYLVTYHQDALRTVQTIIDRVSAKTNATIGRGPDRLAHSILDMLVDNYKPVLDEFQQEIDLIEDKILEKGDEGTISEILQIRKDLSALKQILRPQGEVIARLSRGETKLIRPVLIPYFRNLLDNLNRTEDLASTYAEQLLLTIDVYMNKVANQTNEGIKVLTALTAITLPPTVIGGWYGMNFHDMPELAGGHGYLVAAFITVFSMLLIGIWLKRKNWF